METFKAQGVFITKKNKVEKIILNIALPKDDFFIHKVYNLSHGNQNGLLVVLQRNDQADVSGTQPAFFKRFEIPITQVETITGKPSVPLNHGHFKIKITVFHDEMFDIAKAEKFHDCYKKAPYYDLNNDAQKCYDSKFRINVPEKSRDSILVGL